MIAYLKGTLLTSDRGRLIVNCGGVGYLVNVSVKDLAGLEIGKEVEVYVHTQVKEDILALYGFLRLEDLKLFEKLIGVSGVGPKIGLSIMTTGKSGEIVEALKSGEVEFFTKVPGIGKKNAQRLIVELRNKVGSEVDDMKFLDEGENEVVEALIGLGFAKKEVIGVVKEADKEKAIEEQIKWSLKRLGSR